MLSEETLINWEVNDLKNGPPPQPRFNIYDNDECRNQITEFYKSGLGSYDNAMESEAEIDGMAQKLIDMMKVYDFDFVNNQKFYQWSIRPRDGMEISCCLQYITQRILYSRPGTR